MSAAHIELGRYLTIEYKPHGLQLTLTAEGRELIEEQPDTPDCQLFPDLFEDFCGNGWGMLRAEHIGALTGCEIIVTDDYSVEDDGTVKVYGNVYWHERYAVESLTERLLEGPITLPLAIYRQAPFNHQEKQMSEHNLGGIIAETDVPPIDWHQLPEDAGQIVQYHYAVDEYYLYCRRYDQSDRNTSYRRAEFMDGEFEPWNGILPDIDEWEPIIFGDQADMAIMLHGYGDRFCGNNVAESAQAWLDEGFDSIDAGEWCEIGVWEPSVASQFKQAGVTPERVAAKAVDLKHYTDDDPIYSVCNGDTDINVLID